jgi:hypothetical protein
MTEKITEVDPDLVLLDELKDFTKHSLKIVEETKREILILSKALDPSIYNTEAFYQHILDMDRRDRDAHVKILVKDIRALVAGGHSLLDLARRLPSKIEIRTLLARPVQDSAAYLIGDHKHLLFMHEDQIYNGAVNYDAEEECKEMIDEFMVLWEKQSELDPAVHSLMI